MTLKDLLKKKEKVKDESAVEKPPTLSPDVPEFQFFRTTTSTRESIEPPSFPGDPTREPAPLLSPEPRGLKGRFRRHSNAGAASSASSEAKTEHKLHFGRNRSASSVNVPQNLPDVGGDGVARNEEDEARWEKRATVLVEANTVLKSGANTPSIEVENPLKSEGQRSRSRSKSVSNAPDDVSSFVARKAGPTGKLTLGTG